MGLLDEIIAHKRREVAASRSAVPEGELRALAAAAPPPRDWYGALAAPGLGIVAEIKPRSPSAGVIREGVPPAALAAQYEAGGAVALSVLTDARYFGGSGDALRAARGATTLPVLRKDFVVDACQLYEARAWAADAVLLLAAVHDAAALRDLLALAAALRLGTLVEAHTEAEVDRALAAGARAVGLNTRDLQTLRVDRDTAARLRPRIPPGVLVVAESGIETPADIRRLSGVGVDAVLVGTSLMASGDPAAHLRALREAAAQTGGRTR